MQPMVYLWYTYGIKKKPPRFARGLNKSLNKYNQNKLKYP